MDNKSANTSLLFGGLAVIFLFYTVTQIGSEIDTFFLFRSGIIITLLAMSGSWLAIKQMRENYNTRAASALFVHAILLSLVVWVGILWYNSVDTPMKTILLHVGIAGLIG